MPGLQITFLCFHGRGQTPTVFAQLLKNTRTIFEKKYKCIFRFIRGHYKQKEKGFGWYEYGHGRTNTDGVIRHDVHSTHIDDLIFEYQNKPLFLIGFSEGAAYANEVALTYSLSGNNPVLGVLSMAPSFHMGYLPPHYSKHTTTHSMDRTCSQRGSEHGGEGVYKCDTPVVLVISPSDKNVPMKQSKRWGRYFECLDVHLNNKGHRVHIPLNVRDTMITIIDQRRN